MRAAVLMLLSSVVVPAAAQQMPTQSPNDREMAISSKLLQEINEGLACRAEAAGLRRQVDTLQAELAKLKKGPS